MLCNLVNDSLNITNRLRFNQFKTQKANLVMKWMSILPMKVVIYIYNLYFISRKKIQLYAVLLSNSEK